VQVAILAGGLATRLKPITDEIPKSMVMINGRPFLEYQLGFLERGGVEEIILCVGYLGEQIERYFGNGSNFGVTLKYSYENERLLGTAGALKNAERYLKDRFFVIYGDSFIFLDFTSVMSYFNSYDKLGLMTVYKNHDSYELSNVVVEGDIVKHYSKKNRTEGMVYVDYGASVLRKNALGFVPQGQFWTLEVLLAQLIGHRELLAYEVNERFYQIGSPEGLEEFKRYISPVEVIL
jgi:NDP-sugar pyrophosphorylase family protein